MYSLPSVARPAATTCEASSLTALVIAASGSQALSELTLGAPLLPAPPLIVGEPSDFPAQATNRVAANPSQNLASIKGSLSRPEAASAPPRASAWRPFRVR